MEGDLDSGGRRRSEQRVERQVVPSSPAPPADRDHADAGGPQVGHLGLQHCRVPRAVRPALGIEGGGDVVRRDVEQLVPVAPRPVVRRRAVPQVVERGHVRGRQRIRRRSRTRGFGLRRSRDRRQSRCRRRRGRQGRLWRSAGGEAEHRCQSDRKPERRARTAAQARRVPPSARTQRPPQGGGRR